MAIGFLYIILDKAELTEILINENKLLNLQNEYEIINDEFKMSEHAFKLQNCLELYIERDQEGWNKFFTSSKTYSIKPAVLVQKLTLLDINQKEKVELKKAEEKKEIEDMIL